jgi:hypothetical protein
VQESLVCAFHTDVFHCRQRSKMALLESGILFVNISTLVMSDPGAFGPLARRELKNTFTSEMAYVHWVCEATIVGILLLHLFHWHNVHVPQVINPLLDGVGLTVVRAEPSLASFVGTPRPAIVKLLRESLRSDIVGLDVRTHLCEDLCQLFKGEPFASVWVVSTRALSVSEEFLDLAEVVQVTAREHSRLQLGFQLAASISVVPY